MGYLRLYFAICVMIFHLDNQSVKFAGPLAVFGFYTLSGYLISRVLSTTYKGRPIHFIANRALRIYPAYWCVAIIGLAAALWMPALHPAIVAPETIEQTIRQITIFGLPYERVRLVPPAWSLHIEMCWYLLMIATIRFPRMWLSISLIFMGYALWHSDMQLAYRSLAGTSICFALGASVYVFRDRLPGVNIYFAIALLIGEMIAGNFFSNVWILYCASLITACAIVAVERYGLNRAPMQKLCGDLAYPVFLCHWPLATVVAAVTHFGTNSFALFAATFPVTIVVSLGIIHFVEHPIQILRNSVRKQRRATDIMSGAIFEAQTDEQIGRNAV